MAPPSPPDQRTHLPPSSSQGSGRRIASYPSSQSLRTTPYSSLGDALGGGGGTRAMPYNNEFPNVAGGPITPVAPHISPDGRYYYHSTGVPSAYGDYSHYPPSSSSYDSSQQQYASAHSSLPPMRSASPAPHQSSPPMPSSQYATPAPSATVSYGGHYSQSPYAPPASASGAAQQHQQWMENEWNAHQHASFSSEPVQPQPQMYMSMRHEVTESPQPDQRQYGTVQYSSTPTSARLDDRDAPPYGSAAARGKMRERNYDMPIAATVHTDFDSQQIDFSKLSDTFRQVLSMCTEVSASPETAQGRPPPIENIDRMLRTATNGLRMMHAATISSSSPQDRRPSGDSSSGGEKETSTEMSARRTGDASATENHTCLSCGATSTPEWRRGPLGPRTLCNACGLVYAKLIKKRSREHGASAMSTPNRVQPTPAPMQSIHVGHALASPDAGDSEDELSYGSQDAH